MYESETHGIRVRVEPQFLPGRSEPTEHSYFWAYSIEITNNSDLTVQLLTREWRIIDGSGATQVVQGDGVVGEQPLIEPGETYIYTSGVPLSTPTGFMYGSYRFVDENGSGLDVAIPKFSLDSPFAHASVN